MTDPASRFLGLENRIDKLVKRYSWSRTRSSDVDYLIARCIRGWTYEEIAQRCGETVEDVRDEVSYLLSDHRVTEAELLDQARNDPFAVLDEIAFIVDYRLSRCVHCQRDFEDPRLGRRRHYCTNACRQAAYRRRRSEPGYQLLLDRRLTDVFHPSNVRNRDLSLPLRSVFPRHACRWTEQEDVLLRTLWPTEVAIATYEEIFGREYGSIHRRAETLNLGYSPTHPADLARWQRAMDELFSSARFKTDDGSEEL